LHSFSRRQAGLTGSQFALTWVAEQLIAGNKAQSLFAAIEGLECKRSSNLVHILTIKAQI